MKIIDTTTNETVATILGGENLTLDEALDLIGAVNVDDINNDRYSNDGDKEFAFDARARYAITEKTAVTGMFNYSSIAKELKASKSGDDLNAMWTMISVNHVAGDRQ